MVASTLMSVNAVVKGSWDSKTKSANWPGITCPLRPAQPVAAAEPAV